MDLPSRRRRRKVPFQEQYPTRFQLYTYPPTQDISLSEFEKLATDRQQLLRKVSDLREKRSHGDLDEDSYKAAITSAMNDTFPLKAVNDDIVEMKHIDQRRRDHISHYILRLAYCRTEELRRWFLSQEVELLKARLIQTSRHRDIADLLTRYNQLVPIDRVHVARPDHLPENSKVKEYQLSSDVHKFYHGIDGSVGVECYKVPFTEVLDLTQRRDVVVKDGFAYFPRSEMLVSLMCNKFRSLLSQDLVRTVSHLNVVDSDERIAGLLKHLKETYTGGDFSDIGSNLAGEIRLEMMDTFSRESFPPCMSHLHDMLRKEHHLRHFGRLQYGLFLKSIGLTLERALAFWREEFTKKMEPDKFDKQYAYNVRHSYGKEGKRANYTPYSCIKIITSNGPGPGDHHGCPFRHWDDIHVQQFLTARGVPLKAAQQILTYRQNSHHQLACQKYFEIVHGLQQSSFSLEHPTQYFIESRKVRGEGGVGGGADTRTAKVEPMEEELDSELSCLTEEQLASFENMDDDS